MTAPVWVYFQDIITQENLRLPIKLTGSENEHYDIKSENFDNYIFAGSDEALTGSFTDRPSKVHLWYHKNNFKDAQPIDLFIQILNDHSVQTEPQLTSLVVNKVLRDSIWKTDLRVVDGNGQTWYRIGPDKWLAYNPEHLQLLDKAPDNKKINILDLENKLKTTPNATIDFIPNHYIDVYDDPIGYKPLGSVTHGDLVCTDREQTEGINHWYHIKNLGWINAVYIKPL